MYNIKIEFFFLNLKIMMAKLINEDHLRKSIMTKHYQNLKVGKTKFGIMKRVSNYRKADVDDNVNCPRCHIKIKTKILGKQKKTCIGTKIDKTKFGQELHQNQNKKIWIFLSKIKQTITESVVKKYVVKLYKIAALRYTC